MQDITKLWPRDWQASFDLVHQRLCLAGCGTHHPTQDVVADLVGLVKAGGWIELVELDVRGPKDSGPALREIFTLGGMGGISRRS